VKNPGFRFDGSGRSFQTESVKNTGGAWFDIGSPGQKVTGKNPAHAAAKSYGGGYGWDGTIMREGNSKSPARKFASAMIAKIPLPLAAWIARAYLPKRSPRRQAA